MGLNTDNNSDCSRLPTVNLFRVVIRSQTTALNSALVISMPACADFRLRPT